MNGSANDRLMVWAFIEECLEVGGFTTYHEPRGVDWPWRWIAKAEVIGHQMLWVGRGEHNNLGIVKVGRTASVDHHEKILGEVSLADPEFCPKLLVLLEKCVKLAREQPELFVDWDDYK